MRIIAGKYKGKKLLDPEDKTIIRATCDRIKESIFNIIQENLPESKILDCFCGTGSLGLEALSRGAAKVTFSDINNYSLNLAKQNYNRIVNNPPKEQAEFILGDYKKIFKNFASQNKKFDIIFMDPPYNKNENGECVKLAFENKLLNANGIIIFETSSGNMEFENADKRSYGNKFVYVIISI